MNFVKAKKIENKTRLWIVDCLTGDRTNMDQDVFSIGNSPTCDFNVKLSSGDECSINIVKTEGIYHVVSRTPGQTFEFDGQATNSAELSELGEHTLVIQGYPFTLFLGGEEGRAWLNGIDVNQWYYYEKKLQQWSGPVATSELPMRVSMDPGAFIVLCVGMKKMGFYPHQIIHRLTASLSLDEPAPYFPSTSIDTALEDSPEINSEYGEFTCPVCWFRFDRGDTMNIATHASLRGDPVLGEEHMQRFLASRFNDKGQALDAMGLAAPEIACPHCRRKLPPNFLDQPHHIFSIVGAPSSGKSYYLSVLIKKLQDVCFKGFGVTFRDAAPSENAVLNDMRNHLFSAGSPEEAYLAKTDLEGALYETLPRQGRQVRLPKPFVFRITDQERSDDGFSIVFYDNAGEHFEPGRNSADSPGAQHIAVASGIFFLFDPLYNPDFRRKLSGSTDPQLEQRRSDQQDILLAESEARIKEILGLSASERIATPLSVIAGKSDAWIHLLGDGPLLPAVISTPEGTRVSIKNIEANSTRVRNLLMEVCPSIVANAEAISSNVCYFAASPLGHPPIQFEDAQGQLRIGPDPAKLDPRMVEDATLWVLSQVAPSIFPQAL